MIEFTFYKENIWEHLSKICERPNRYEYNRVCIYKQHINNVESFYSPNRLVPTVEAPRVCSTSERLNGAGFARELPGCPAIGSAGRASCAPKRSELRPEVWEGADGRCNMLYLISERPHGSGVHHLFVVNFMVFHVSFRECNVSARLPNSRHIQTAILGSGKVANCQACKKDNWIVREYSCPLVHWIMYTI